jgi:metal-responsive CopG/Arc/MetJ family transcriptional regulator
MTMHKTSNSISRITIIVPNCLLVAIERMARAGFRNRSQEVALHLSEAVERSASEQKKGEQS